MALITIKEAAARVGKTPATLYLAIRNGELKSEERYGIRLVSEADMERYKPRGRGRPQVFRADIALRTDISQSELARELGVSRQRVNQVMRKEAHLARNAVASALRRGKITVPDRCERCKLEKSLQAHHPDYSKPLDVQWLCVPCHNLVHPHHNNIHGNGRLLRKDTGK
jgi:hypothetical protein